MPKAIFYLLKGATLNPISAVATVLSLPPEGHQGLRVSFSALQPLEFWMYLRAVFMEGLAGKGGASNTVN